MRVLILRARCRSYAIFHIRRLDSATRDVSPRRCCRDIAMLLSCHIRLSAAADDILLRGAVFARSAFARYSTD